MKEKLEAKYQRVTDSKSKIKSALWRAIPQDSRDRLMVHYNFIRWQTNLREAIFPCLNLFSNNYTIFYESQ